MGEKVRGREGEREDFCEAAQGRGGEKVGGRGGEREIDKSGLVYQSVLMGINL